MKGGVEGGVGRGPRILYRDVWEARPIWTFAPDGGVPAPKNPPLAERVGFEATAKGLLASRAVGARSPTVHRCFIASDWLVTPSRYDGGRMT